MALIAPARAWGKIPICRRWGIAGVSFCGGESMPGHVIVQSTAFSHQLRAQRLKDEFNRHRERRNLMLRYTRSLITQRSQTVMALINPACIIVGLISGAWTRRHWPQANARLMVKPSS